MAQRKWAETAKLKTKKIDLDALRGDIYAVIAESREILVAGVRKREEEKAASDRSKLFEEISGGQTAFDHFEGQAECFLEEYIMHKIDSALLLDDRFDREAFEERTKKWLESAKEQLTHIGATELEITLFIRDMDRLIGEGLAPYVQKGKHV